MLAVVKTRPEKGVELLERPVPSIRNEDHVLIKVEACGICGSDVHFYEWPPEMKLEQMVSIPRILGHELAGIVEETGKNVVGFEPGDRVVSETWGGCGFCYHCRLGRFNHCMHQTRIGQQVDGAMTDYVVVPYFSLYTIPEDIDTEEAAVIEPLGVALHAFERCEFKPGDDVVVIGPGPIGLLAVQIALSGGAGKVGVLGLDIDRERLKMAAGFGATPINAEQEDPYEIIAELTHGKGADLVLDISGGRDTLTQAIRLSKPGGQVVEVGLGQPAEFNYTELVSREVTVHGSFRRQPSTWYRAINMVASNVVDLRPLISHVLPVSKAVEGFGLLIERQAVKVVLIPGEK
jgi:2-desacetyl-2-hydroxyethyl bacteriochlorophyllide A dehydrogenase